MVFSLELGVLIGLLTASVSGLWAVRKMLESKRADQAVWLHKLFIDFYLRDEFRSLRKQLEYGDELLSELIERRVSRRELGVAAEEADRLCSLDSFLNYLELLFTLEQQGQVRRRDRNALFRYWNDVLCLPHNAALRRYLERFGFEAIVKMLPPRKVSDSIIPGEEYFALYGSLTRSGGMQGEAKVEQQLEFVGNCLIPGRILDLGHYPGLIEGQGQVKAELFRSSDSQTFALLDSFEKYLPGDVEKSLFRRKCVWLPSCDRDCWVYYFAGTRDQSHGLIPGGSWEQHRRD